MNNRNENFIDHTILTTPKPCASSTIERKEILKLIDEKYARPNFDNSSIIESVDSSLGLIEKDCLLQANESRVVDSLSNLQKQRELAHTTLEKSKLSGLPSRFLIPSSETLTYTPKGVNNASTVNESDLFRMHASKSSLSSNTFNPNDISTPRNSASSNSKLLYNKIRDISQEIRNSEGSLKDLCSELNRFSITNTHEQVDMPCTDSGVFIPAELMEEQLLKDELSWRRERDIPTKLRTTNISNLENSSAYSGKYSLGDFFKGRSDNINNDFFKKSPDRKSPIPLVDLTNTITELEPSSNSTNLNVSQEDSLISITHIQKFLAECGTEDTPRIINCLLNKQSLRNMQGNAVNNTMASEKDVDEFVAGKYSLTNKDISNQKYSIGPPIITTSSPTFIESRDSYSRINNVGDRSNSRMSKTPETSLYGSRSLNTKSTIQESNAANYYPMASIMVNSPTENKENDSNRSLTSVRSGSSLDTLPEGKSPIKSNRLELVWGCVKVGRTSIQEFQIRNQLNQRVRMQASVTGSSFRIVKDSYDSEMQTVSTFMLRPQETKTFSIMFCPTTQGAAFEKINFYPILCGEVQHTKRQILALYGYGGHSSCDIGNVAKDSNGKLWLTFGKIHDRMYIEQKFVIKNNGSLYAFASLDIGSKGHFTFSDLKIEPREIVVGPHEEVAVSVRYNPTKVDFKYLNKMDVVEVGVIKLIIGPEAIRGRIRRLCTKLKQKSCPVEPLIERLCKPFLNEKIPSDLMSLRESVSAMKELLLQLSFKEITLTIERDPESTLVNPINIEESSIYHTLYQDDDEGDSTLLRKNNKSFKVEPRNVLLTLPMKTQDTVLLHSDSSQSARFEIKTEDGVFGASPCVGILGPNETAVIKIFCKQSVCENVLERFLIYIENEAVEITVKSVFIKLK